MKITEKLLIIPPYISTTWNHVSAIHMKGNLLAVTLEDGDTINVPGLKQDVIDSLFNFHAQFLENEVLSDSPERENNRKVTLEQSFEMPFRLGIASLDGISNVMQHNPTQSNAPEIPLEILSKICAITKIMSPDESLLPKPEHNCNCPHCQIARTFHSEFMEIETFDVEEDDVPVTELQFQQWDIHQTDEKLFTVVNRLDQQEKYNVFLGQPVGCTCGKEGCEHILAVLKS